VWGSEQSRDPSDTATTFEDVQAARAPWSSASFLAYLGGLTILSALGALLGEQSGHYGAGGFSGWALLIFAIVTTFAVLALLAGHRVTAGLFALSSVGSFVVVLGALLDWLGWLDRHPDSPFGGFRVSLLFLELALVVASAVALAVFRFPLLVFVLAAASWFFVTDLLSGGGDWSVLLTILYGLALLPVAAAVDAAPQRPYGFWLHVVSGLTIGGGLLWFFHDGDWDWIVIAAVGLAYIALGDRIARSSWTVLGAWGILQVTAHFAEKWSEVTSLFFTFYLFPFVLLDAFGEDFPSSPSHPWAGALLFALVGGGFIAIGLLLARRRREAAL
jgi:hypothetical protein